MNSATLIQTTVQARRDLAALVALQDHHLTDEGLVARKRSEWRAIRDRLTAAIPAEPTTPERGPVIATLAAKTADDLAFQAREWEKVRALLDAGRYLPHIVADADRVRLAAILDNLETMPEVLSDSDGASIVESVREAVWERLVQVDDAAKAIAAAEEATAPVVAWRAILAGMAETGEVPFEGLTLLHQTDRDAHELLLDGDALAAPGSISGAIPRLVSALAEERVPV